MIGACFKYAWAIVLVLFLSGAGCNEGSYAPRDSHRHQTKPPDTGRSSSLSLEDTIANIRSSWEHQSSIIAQDDKDAPIKRINILVALLQELPADSLKQVRDSALSGNRTEY